MIKFFKFLYVKWVLRWCPHCCATCCYRKEMFSICKNELVDTAKAHNWEKW